MTDDKITALVARLRRTSGFLEEYEFEGAASEAAGLMNEAADALEASVRAVTDPKTHDSGEADR